MHPEKNVFVVVIAFVLALVVIACSCGQILPTSVTANPLPGLEGTWTNPDSGDVYQFAWQDGKYVVLSCTWQQDEYEISSQSWEENTLTWSYYDTYYNATVSVNTVSLNGDDLEVKIDYGDGTANSIILQRGAVADGSGNDLTGNSETITSLESHVLTSTSGVTITIPGGAVPANPDGSVGSLVFNIEEDLEIVPTLPAEVFQVGPVIRVEPEGVTFNLPVSLSFPIPENMDVSRVMGAAYYDPVEAAWLLVPGTVNAISRTVEITTTHLSTWTAWGYTAVPGEGREGGYFKVVYPQRGTEYGGPQPRYSQASTWHGICVTTMTFQDEAAQNWWLPPIDYTITATTYAFPISYGDPGEAASYWMPAGTYRLVEIFGQSEYNPGDSLYIPKYYHMWREFGTVTLGDGQSIEFPDPQPMYGDTGWSFSRPPCWGMTLPSTNGTENMPTTTPNPTAVAYAKGFEGVWETNWGEMTCSVQGVQVFCDYEWDAGRINATLSADGVTMTGQWSEEPSYSPPDDAGRVLLTLSEDGNSLYGDWSYGDGESAGTWTGNRTR